MNSILDMASLAKLLTASIAILVILSGNTEGNDDIKTAKRSTRNSLHVGAFNIRSFGKSKMKKADIVEHIVTILNRYDVVLIQEVKDSSQTAIAQLLRRLNDLTGDDWEMLESERLGSGRSYKEQYVFFYRTEKARVLYTYQIPENEIYAREPFCIELEYGSSDKRVVLMGLHAAPREAVSELTELASSIREVAEVFPDADGVVAMGDFNADCSYVTARERGDLEIFWSYDFDSLIPDEADTTSGRSDCAYDRIIVYGSDVRTSRGRVYDFQEDLGLSATTAGKVSDHYPVEFTLY